MNETTAALLKELAAKLGTTVEHIYAVLLRQVPIWIAENVISALLSFAGSMLLCWCALRLWRTDEAHAWSDPLISERFTAVVIGLIAVIGLLITESNAMDAVTGWLNPEFAVLSYIMGHLR